MRHYPHHHHRCCWMSSRNNVIGIAARSNLNSVKARIFFTCTSFFALAIRTVAMATSASTTSTRRHPQQQPLLLRGKRVLITGAGRGIGRAMAVLCHEQGAHVAICARTASQLHETAALAQATPSVPNPDRDEGNDPNDASCAPERPEQQRERPMLIRTVDVTQPDQVQQMVNDLVNKEWNGRGPDVLINNAGRGQAQKGPLTALETAELASLLQLNVVALHTVTAATVPYMKRGAHIINISSKAGKMGLPNMSHYVASKFAVEGLTAAWAADLASQGIAVNSISPGMVNTTSFPKPANRPGVRSAESIADGLWLLLSSISNDNDDDDNVVTGHYLHVDELDMVRAKGLPDTRALKPINEPNFADTLV